MDAELHSPFAGIADDLEEAVNYAAAYAAIREEVTEKTHQLIEVLADRIAAARARLPHVERGFPIC